MTITFDGDPERDSLEEFGALVVGSPWLQTVGAEYGVGVGAQVARVHLGPAPSSLTQAQAIDLVQEAIAKHPPASRDTLYMLHVPSTVAHPMIGDHGFHTQVIVSNAQVAISVALGDAATPSTVIAARQLINAVTDPYMSPSDGWYADPPESDPWSVVRGEVADLCDRAPAQPLDDEHPALLMPRVYSNRASTTGPCVPAVADEIWVDITADPTRIPSVPRGGQVLFRLTGWSTQQTVDWPVTVLETDTSGLSYLEMSPELNVTGTNNGRRAVLILHAPSNADIGQVGAVYVLSGPNHNPWPVAFRVE